MPIENLKLARKVMIGTFTLPSKNLTSINNGIVLQIELFGNLRKSLSFIDSF